MSSQKIKQLEDEILDLRGKVALLSDFGQEKDRMLSTIALLVDRLGGIVTVGKDDLPFIQAWNDGRIIMEVAQNADTAFNIRFSISKQEVQDAKGQ